MNRSWDRRAMLRAGILGATAAGLGQWPAWARTGTPGIADPLPEESGGDIHLRIGQATMRIDGRDRLAIGINGGAPAPILRLREGRPVRIRVDNTLDEETSLHWHGLILPFQMDGVPGVSFPGIAPRSTFTYEFPVVQAGTYWYHSHSGLQEQLGLYGPIVIDPAGADPIASDRQHVVMLSDHSRLPPHVIFRKLKQEPGYFNMQRQTLAGLLAGRDQGLKDRLDWGAMRMDPTDISDVTGSTYDYLVNGHGPRDNWTALFRPGERVRLRLVNASAMTIFNVRIPGLKLTVVQADGLDVRPVTVDELQIAVAETYDVIVEPAEDRAYTIVGEAVDRSGMARATLAPRLGMAAEVPPLRRRPVADMTDMGMDMSGMEGFEMDMSMRNPANAPSVAMGPGVQTISPMPKDRTGEPGQGLADVGHKVLVYRDLVARDRNPDVRAPTRSIDVHLTGNMERYMWSFDGKTLSEARDPIPIRVGERVRVNLINDTMMAHPIHLHGHFFELVTGHGDHSPRKHTVNVAPGGLVSFDVTGVEGDWAFHCHMLYHMHAGMMRVVQVRAEGGAA
ncbi:copper resistance system multicopper oxidase [Rhizorhabdus histidinilytica]|uniref:Copper-resistance protein, CopA family n=1 Tax=Rhizorhabdus histidinilytica TaxID=439228 RepID=A0A1T5FYG8_9SPHN|nr:copper resistance system multicopper oxidase [Rhizorhabdus histidinilytica]SKC01189.1 copper-resistance protein, CopA family [Rhizorhabdus histidinilytica]